MTSDFNSHNDFRQLSDKNSPANSSMHTDTLDVLKRDRFELLSAYLDGEVTAAERKQVEEWLATDSVVQQLYARLLKLRQGFRTLPVPAEERPIEQTVDQVFARIDRRPKLAVVWGGAGAAVAALFVAAVSGILPGGYSPAPQVAVESSPATVTAVAPEVMKIALDRPVVHIPKAAVAEPGRLGEDELNRNSTIR
jgi:anti-sigma factor RsiW